MKKRWMLLLIAAAAAVVLSAAAGEETAAAPDLYDIYDYGAESVTWLGTAVPVSDEVLIISGAELPEDKNTLVAFDGEEARDVEDVLVDDSGAMAMVVLEPKTDGSAMDSFGFAPSGAVISPQNAYVLSGDEQGSRINRAIYTMAGITWNGYECMLLELTGDAAPGSVVMTDDGDLAGIIIAEYAEGEDRYIALTADGLLSFVGSEAAKLKPWYGEGNAPEGYSVTVDGNAVTFDWSAMTLEDGKEGETLYLIIADTENSYLTYIAVSKEQRSHTMILTPGRTYLSGLVWADSAPNMYPEEYAVTALPEAEKLTDYGFTSRVCALAKAPDGGLADGARPTVATEVTEKDLRSGRMYFYSSSSYHVDETMDNLTLLITLETPEGENYQYLTGWVYDPSYMEDDTWFVTMDETKLLDKLNDEGYPAGVYEMAFYVGGKFGDGFTFELKQGE